MTELARVFVTDPSDVPIEGAQVAFHRISTGETIFVTTDVDGKAEAGLEEEKYSVSVAKTDFLSPAAFTIEPSPAPAAAAAFFNPPAQANPLLISLTKNLVEITVDPLLNPANLPVLIDVSTPTPVSSVDDIAANINAALAAVNAGWSAVAAAVLGEVRLTSPTTGSLSSIAVTNDGITIGAADATDAVFGLELGAGNILVVGTDAPTDWNDFDAVLTPKFAFSATNPNHCVLWGKLWRHELANPRTPAPLSQRTVWIEVIERPTAIDVGIDIGDSFYVTSDDDGIFSFELMRNVTARMYVSWLDKSFEFRVPDADSVNLDSLISPYLVSLQQTQPEAVSMAVGDVLTFSASGVLSDTSVVNPDNLEYASSNAAVASFSDSDNPSQLEALTPGVSVVQISARNTKNELIVSNEVTVTVVA